MVWRKYQRSSRCPKNPSSTLSNGSDVRIWSFTGKTIKLTKLQTLIICLLQQIIDGLKALGHKVHRDLSSIVCALRKEKDQISANADYRKGGDVFGLT